MNKEIKYFKLNGIRKPIEGKSAYDIACELGFEGTVEDWLASLNGKQGEKGEKGEGAETYGTLRGLPTHNGYINNSATWNNINEAYQHVLIPVNGGQKLVAKSVYFGCLTDYSDPVYGASASLSADPSFSKRMEVYSVEKEFTLPEDAKYLAVFVIQNGEEKYPEVFTIDGYDFLKGAYENVITLSAKVAESTDDLAELKNECVSASALYNGFKLHTKWESGGFGMKVGETSVDGTNVIRQRSEYMTFPDEVKIVIDGTFGINLCTYDTECKFVKASGYVNKAWTFTVEPNTIFRMLACNASDMSADISNVSSDTINASISITCDGLKNIANPNVRWCAMGDSITEGHISYYENGEAKYNVSIPDSWAEKLRRIKRWNLTNRGIGGTGYVYKGNSAENRAAYKIAESIDFAQFDLVTLAYGVNDWKYNQPLGTFDDALETPSSIYSGLRKTIETIITSNPLCKIVVITPINCRIVGVKETNWGLGYAYSNNGTLEDIFNAIKTVCAYYGVEMVDMTHSSIVNRMNIETCLIDKVHPTADTHTVMAHELAAKIPFN